MNSFSNSAVRHLQVLAVVAFAAVLAACGGGGAADSAGSVPTSKVALFAGNLDGLGNVDGTGAQARFNLPSGVAIDSAGNVYVADTGNHAIRGITPEGDVFTLAGTAEVSGSTDGVAASFYRPSSVATDSAGNVYVTDSSVGSVRKITPDGLVSTLAGSDTYGNADGTGAAAGFHGPGGIAADSAGTLHVADTTNDTIRKVTPAGVVSTLAGMVGETDSVDGPGSTARFFSPGGVAADSAGNVYVADTRNHTIRKITSSGVVSTLAGNPAWASGPGSADGTGAAASFNFPNGIAADSVGNLYVADTNNHTIRKITPAGVVSTLAGMAGVAGSADGTGAAARFNGPLGVATDSAGNVYVADTRNSTIRKITPAGVVSTLAGKASVTGSVDGTGAAASFNGLSGIATDNAGNAYVADLGNNTIRKITPQGVVSTQAGTAGTIGSADGTGVAASFNAPSGVAVDGSGNVYVTDKGNSTIRKITPAGVVSTLAGTAGVTGSADGTGAAASFNFPDGIAIDGAGNLYVADTVNHTIRKITSSGVVSTLAGTAGVAGSADATGSAAGFNAPTGIATDSAGNVYVVDTGNSTLRKITPAGVVSTLAGAAGVAGSADGTGSAAGFSSPGGVAIDAAGNAYVADTGNNTVRKITQQGVVSTVVGVASFAGFTGTPSRWLSYPIGVALSGRSIYITMYNGVGVVNNLP